MKALIRTIVVALCLAGVGRVALADPPPAAAAPKDNEGFEQVNGDMMQSGETIPGNRLVGLAYGFICAAVIVWVASVAQRARKLEDEVEAIKKKIG